MSDNFFRSAQHIFVYQTLPALATPGDIAYQISDNAFYTCSSANAWIAIGSGGGGIGGSTGSVDNALLTASGTGGSTLKSSPVLLNSNGQLSGYKYNPILLDNSTVNLTEQDSGSTIWTEVGDGPSTAILPAHPIANTHFRFACPTASGGDTLTVKASGVDVIQVGVSASSVAGTAVCSTSGGYLHLEYITTGNFWMGTMTGTWVFL